MQKLLLLAIFSLAIFADGFNTQMQNYIEELKIEAKKTDSSFEDFDATRGEKIFTSKHIGKRGEKISCTSCHNTDLSKEGKNVFTNKLFEPLSPKTNPERLNSVKEVKKWLRRNFKDVYVREGTALEKGDVLYYIKSK